MMKLGLVWALLALLVACGGAAFSSADVDAGVADGRELADSLPVDVSLEPPADAPVDPAEAGPKRDGSTDAAAAADVAELPDSCGRPATAPPASCTCQQPAQGACAPGAPGCVWVEGPVQSSGGTCTGCWLYPLAGADACQACASTDTCACLAHLGLAQCSCVDTPQGPYFGGC
jgi:hypothetical protein